MSDDRRRERMIKLASAATFLAIVVVAVLIVISAGGGSGGDSENVVGAAEVERELQGIPQEGMVLGQSSAKVTLIEFADLQCPVCKAYSEEVLPQVIQSQISQGAAKIDYRAFTIIDENSTLAAEAAVAAGKQGRGWNYVEIFYRNQGTEGSGYVTDEFLTAVAEAAKVPDIARWNRERKSTAVKAEVEEQTAEAQSLGFSGTPSLAVEGPATNGVKALGFLESPGDIEAAISAAAK